MIKKKKKVVAEVVPLKKKKLVARNDMGEKARPVKELSRADRLQARSAALRKSAAGAGSYKYFIFKEGDVRMRPLPVPEDQEFAVETTNFFFGKEIGGFVSPATFGDPCPAMNAYKALRESSDEDDRELANKFKPKKKYMSPHIKYKDLKGKEVDDEAGVKLAQLTNGQYQDLITLYLDEEESGDFTDPNTGYDILYKRVGTGMTDTEYSLIKRNPTKLPKQYNKIYDPEQMVRDIIPPVEEIEQMLRNFLNLDVDDPLPGEGKKKDRFAERGIAAGVAKKKLKRKQNDDNELPF